MRRFLLPLLLPLALCSACTPPAIVWDSIDVLFSMQVLNNTRAAVHQQYITLSPSGGGDQHVFLGPSGDKFQLQGGAWTHRGSNTRAVVSTQRDPDGTRMLFFTQRTQQLAVLQARFACADDGDDWRVLFALTDGAATCVRLAGGRYELRYRPVGVDAPACIDVVLAADPPLPLE